MTTAHDDHDFRQLAGRFNQPVAPSPAFAADLRRRLAMTPNAAPKAATIESAAISHAAVPTGRTGETPDDLPWRAPRWMRVIEAAAAVLLVVSLAGASLYFRQPAAVYDLAFQSSADTVPDEFNYGGDAGRTWVLGDVEPETGGYRVDPNIPLADMQLATLGYSRLLIDDSLIFSAGPDSAEGTLVRYDLGRSEQVWVTSENIAGQIASDGSRIFAFRVGAGQATDSITLFAIDFETGGIAWEGPELAYTPHSSPSLVISNGTVYATDYLGNVVAVKSDDGSLTWQYPDPIATPANEVPSEVPIGGELAFLTPEIVAKDESVFVGLPSRAVLKLDRETGANQGSIDLEGNYGADIFYTTIQVRDNRLVIAVVYPEQKDDERGVFGYFPANILVFDAGSLRLQTQTDVRNYGGNIVLTDEAAYVPASLEPGGISSVYRLDYANGELGEPLQGVQSTRAILLSASGNVLMAAAYPSSIAFIDLDSGDLINGFEFETPILETPFSRPVPMWNSNPIVITSLGGIYVVEDETGD